MMKRWTVLICAVLLTFAMAGCGRSGASTSGPSEITAGAGEKTTGNQNTDDNADLQISRPALELGTRYIWEGDTDKDLVYASGNHTTLRLTADSQELYPELSESLDTYMTAYTDRVNQAISEYIKTLKEDPAMEEYTPEGYVTWDKLYVRRSDHGVLSVLRFSYVDSGGAHGLYGYESLNLDASTGDALTLEDVIADTGLLGQRIKEELLDRYGKDAFFDDMADTIDKEIKGEDDYKLTWTLDPQGISFYFNLYEISPYASGIQTVSLLYDREYDLFTGRYLPEEGGYLCEVPTNLDYFTDVDRDGKTDRVEISYSGDQEMGDISGLMIRVNEQELNIEDYYCYDVRPRLVYAPDGAVYLYVWRSMDNDYVSMSIFDLSSGTPVSIEEMDLSEARLFTEEKGSDYDSYIHTLTDPGNMLLSTRFDLMSTYDAGRTYHVSGAPTPVSEENYYMILRNLTLNSRKEIVADLVDEAGNVTESARKIPSGTTFKLYRTDGKELVDALLEDGRIVRFTVTGDFPQTVNGSNAEEVFEELFYAG